jgi:hypothetical protein
MACRTWMSQLLFACRSTTRQGIKPLKKLRNILCCSFSIHYDHKAYSQMRQVKDKHATKYASLHSSLLYRKRIDGTVQNYEGPLIVWAGVIGTEGLAWVIIAVGRHEAGVPRASRGHRLMAKAHTIATLDMSSLISTKWVRCNHGVLWSTPVHYHTY